MANQTKFTIENIKAFLAELALLKMIVKKSSIPVLECVKVEITDGKMILTGTDLDNTIISTQSVFDAVPGSFVVHLQTFSDAVKKAKREINISVSETSREHNDGTADEPKMRTIKNISVALTVDGSAFSIEGVDIEQFPELPNGAQSVSLGELPGNVLQDLLEKSVFNATQEQSRFTLSAVALEFGKTGLRVIGTDGHRLGYAETKDFTEIKAKKVKKGDLVTPNPENYLLNLSGAKMLSKAINGKVQILHDDKHLFFKTDFGARFIITRKPSGNFPNYRMILPKENIYSFQFHAKELLPIVRNAIKFSDERTKSVLFQPYYNNFVVKSSGGEKSFTGKTACDFPQNSAPGMMVNGQFLVDACNAASNQTLTLSYKHNGHQFDITGECALSRFRFTIMPLGLGKDVDTENFQAITVDEKVDLRLVPFYKQAASVETSKPNKKAVIGDIQSLLDELKAISGIDGLPDMFAEITGEIVENLTGKIKLLG